MKGGPIPLSDIKGKVLFKEDDRKESTFKYVKGWLQSGKITNPQQNGKKRKKT